MDKVNEVACPACGCWLAREFACSCGAAHGRSCVNCGRYTAPTLKPDEHLALGEFDQRCNRGPVLHQHERE